MDSGAQSSDVVIVGAGVIGLAAAWALARAGASVTVLDSSAPGGGATRAAAGMLAPMAEAAEPGPFFDLCAESLRLYPGFLESLRCASGTSIDSMGPGMLRIARTAKELGQARTALSWQSELGFPVELIDRERLASLEPGVTGENEGAVLSPLERHIDAPALSAALVKALRSRGVRILENRPAVGCSAVGGAISVKTTDGPIECAHLVLAAGCWSGPLARDLGISLPVKPVRGQIVALRTPDGPSHTIYSHRGYIVPRSPGIVIAGATMEHAGFSARVTAGGIASVIEMAVSLMPALANAEFETAWAGLRPALPDGLPAIGPVPGCANVWIAAGHFRNGILLAPVTARLLCDAMQSGSSAAIPAPFRPERFSSGTQWG